MDKSELMNGGMDGRAVDIVVVYINKIVNRELSEP